MSGNIAEVPVDAREMTFRAHRFVPAVVLLAAGFAVTFTQDLHEVLSFNVWVVAIFGVLYGAALFAAPALGGTRRAVTSAIAALSILVGVAAPFMRSAAGLGLILLVWASAIAVTELLRWAQTRQRDALAVGIFAALLAVILAFGARDLPAVMGFFAAYCIIVGVYVGIAAFERQISADEAEASSV